MQAKVLAFSFVNSQFNYCAIIWMFCCKKSSLKWEQIHKQTLRVVFNEYEKKYTNLLVDHDKTGIHWKHLQFLATDVFKLTSKLNPQITWSFFENCGTQYNRTKV